MLKPSLRLSERSKVAACVVCLCAGLLATASAVADGAYGDDGAVMLTIKLEKSRVGDLVFAGEFDRAIEEADRQMEGRVTGEWLYLRAMAKLGKAEQSRAERDYKDAGLDFMRVVVYFPSSPYASPSLVEVGYVHDRLGLTTKADELYAQARAVLKAEQHPRYLARCKKLSDA